MYRNRILQHFLYIFMYRIVVSVKSVCYVPRYHLNKVYREKQLLLVVHATIAIPARRAA